jgi:hypothetical protein
MVRNRSVRVAVCLLAMTWVSTASRASSLADEYYDSDLANQSAFLRWMAGTELSGRAAPLAIANRPCYVYEGSRLVVLPCPGTVVATAVEYAPPPPGGYPVPFCRYRCRHHGGWVNSRY